MTLSRKIIRYSKQVVGGQVQDEIELLRCGSSLACGTAVPIVAISIRDPSSIVIG